jgi:hypothetical protein
VKRQFSLLVLAAEHFQRLIDVRIADVGVAKNHGHGFVPAYPLNGRQGQRDVTLPRLQLLKDEKTGEAYWTVSGHPEFRAPLNYEGGQAAQRFAEAAEREWRKRSKARQLALAKAPPCVTVAVKDEQTGKESWHIQGLPALGPYTSPEAAQRIADVFERNRLDAIRRTSPTHALAELGRLAFAALAVVTFLAFTVVMMEHAGHGGGSYGGDAGETDRD